MLWIIAIINFIYAPLMVFLRNPPGKEEKQVTCRKLISLDIIIMSFHTYIRK